ncbi:MAG: hypothetical protein AB8U25_02835 [Rickettsiales endosymbiont of Dermacentor nuttalli]
MDIKLVAAKDLFGLDIDHNYCFDQETLISILVGFKYNMIANRLNKVIIQDYHGTCKSTRLEQVAAKL